MVSALRAAGALVQDLSGVGRGVPDLLVGIRGQMMLMEVKDGRKPPSARHLTTEQVKWHAKWAGYPISVVDSAEAALRHLKVLGG